MITLFLIGVSIALHVYGYFEQKKIPWDDGDNYVDVSGLAFLCWWKNYTVGLTLFFCCFKLLDYISINSTFAIPVFIIRGMVLKIGEFMLIFIIFIAAFGFFSSVVYGVADPSSTMWNRSMFNQFGSAITGDVDFDAAFNQDSLSWLICLMFTFTMIIIIMNLLIAVMTEAYEEVNENAKARWCYLQFDMLQKKAAKEFGEILSNNGLAAYRWALMDAGALTLQDAVHLPDNVLLASRDTKVVDANDDTETHGVGMTPDDVQKLREAIKKKMGDNEIPFAESGLFDPTNPKHKAAVLAERKMVSNAVRFTVSLRHDARRAHEVRPDERGGLAPIDEVRAPGPATIDPIEVMYDS